MNILVEITREARRLESEIGKLERQLRGLKAAENALRNSSVDRGRTLRKRILSAAARAKMSQAAKRRWAKVKASARKAAT